MKCAEALSKLAPLQDQFAVRYYRWCLQESLREMEGDFPSIRSIPSHVAFLFLDFVESHSRQEIRSLMIGGIKRFNPRAAELTDSSITAEEDALHQRFVAFFRDEVTLHGQRLSGVRIPTRESRLRDRELTGQTTTNIKSKELKHALQKTLDSVLGKPERAPSSGLQFSKTFGSWHLTTSLDLAGHAQLNYSHWVGARRRIDLCPTHLNPGICPMNWYGIHPGTSFDLIEASEVQRTAETVAKFCARVLDLAPELLTGLEHDLPEEIEDSPQIPLRVH